MNDLKLKITPGNQTLRASTIKYDGADALSRETYMKIAADTQLRTYELTYLVLASLTDGEITTIKDSINKIIKKLKGKEVSSDDWGKKTLAYKIRFKGKYEQQAYFIHQVVELDPAQVTKLEQELRLNPDLMRFLLVKGEKTERLER